MLPADTDEKIIDLLLQNADLTYKEIAKKLRLNESTVRKRVLSLRKRGVIRKFLVEVDAEKLGYRSRALLLLDVDPLKMMEVGRKLVLVPEARFVGSTSGGHDFYVMVWTKNTESLAQVIDHVATIEGVAKITPCFIVERLK